MKQIAVLGMPNTGKSTFFNRITGANASIGNWPGITVDLMMAKVILSEEPALMVDLPGIYDLRGFSEDEEVVRRFLERNPVHLVLMVLNATQIDRQISLALQVKHLQVPAVLLLNMADEAPKFGVTVDAGKMAEHLGMPVVPISAKYGHGYDMACQAIANTLERQEEPVSIGSLEEHFVAEPQIESEMGTLLRDAVHAPPRVGENWTDRLDRVLLHPVLGLPIFFGAMFLMFQAVYAIGTPLQDLMGNGFDWFQKAALEPLLGGLPDLLKGFLIDGVYNGITTVAAFIPVIVLFFIFVAVVEDSG